MKDRCTSGSAPAFLRRRRGRPDRIVGSRGARGLPSGAGRVPDGRPDRPGASGAFACPGTARSPQARAAGSPQAVLFCPPSPPFWSPEPALWSPEPALAARAPAFPRLSCLSSAFPRTLPRRRKPAFACGVPGALRGTRASPTRFDEDERPVSRERLDMRGTHSHEASSWARGYYAE